MKALIIGRSGQLARALLASVPAGTEVTSLQRSDLDLEASGAIAAAVETSRAQIVINAAAYTAVDRAESEPERAYAVNARAVGVLGDACAHAGARIVHLSTDFVFDGKGSVPYLPDDATAPLNVYGASKLEGERRLQVQAGLDWRIIRTAWVYASDGRNFVLTMLRLFNERPRVQVVADQVGTPTSAASLAQCVWRAALDTGPAGLFHFTDAGVASWYDFAVAIYEEAGALGLITNSVEIVPVGTAEYPTRARRPSYSVLDKRSTLARLGLVPRHWRIALREVLRELQK